MHADGLRQRKPRAGNAPARQNFNITCRGTV